MTERPRTGTKRVTPACHIIRALDLNFPDFQCHVTWYRQSKKFKFVKSIKRMYDQIGRLATIEIAQEWATTRIRFTIMHVPTF